jgi:hypothetical protein
MIDKAKVNMESNERAEVDKAKVCPVPNVAHWSD